MAHGDTVGNGDGTEFARGAAGGGDALLDRLGLAHQRNIAGCGFVPARRHADKRLVDLTGGQPHGIEIGAVRRPFRALRHMTARQSLLDVGLGVHREPVSAASPCSTRKNRSWKKTKSSFAFASAVAVSLRRNDFMEGCG